MPKRGKGQGDDLSPGDGRKRYTDIGGVEARHAQTHDVRREELANPKGPDRSGDEFADDIAPATPSRDLHTHADESASAAEDKALHDRLQELSAEELGRLPVLAAGARLDQGATYLDLNDRARVPIAVNGTREATPDSRYVAKKDVDYELWNRLVGHERAVPPDRPQAADQGTTGR